MYGYSQPQGNTGDMLRRIFLSKNILSRLILINTVIYLLVQVVNLFTWLVAPASMTGGLSVLGQVLALPSDLTRFAQMPWTLVTYMFLHEGLFHWLFNMIMLYFGGILFTEYLSQKKLLWTYLLGGISGAVFYMLAFNLFPVFASVRNISVALGASASVLAIIIAISTYVPDYTVHLFLIGRLKLKYLAIAFVLLDILSIQSSNPGGHIAHLGGALWGFLYALSLRNGNDWYRILDTLQFPTHWFKSTRKAHFSTSRPESGRPMNDVEYNERKAARQAEIDRILDKISKSGYGSLTKAEKELLFHSSKEN